MTLEFRTCIVFGSTNTKRRSRSSEDTKREEKRDSRSRSKNVSFDNPAFICDEENNDGSLQFQWKPKLVLKLSLEATKPAIKKQSESLIEPNKEKVPKSVHFFDEEHLAETTASLTSPSFLINSASEQQKITIDSDPNAVCENKRQTIYSTREQMVGSERRRSGSEECVSFQGGHEDLYDRGFCCMGYPRVAIHSLMDDNLEIIGVVIHCGTRNVIIKQGYAFDIAELQFLNDIIQECRTSCDAEAKLKDGGINWDFTQQCYHFRRSVWVMSSLVIRSVCYCGLNIICLPLFHKLVSRRCPISRAFQNTEDWILFKTKLNSITPSRNIDFSNIEETHRKTIYERLDAS